MLITKSNTDQNSGIPLGGIGSGSVEIRPDGYFHEWQIFNLGKWAPQQPECSTMKAPDMPPGALSFFIRTQTKNNTPLVRRLGIRADQHNLYSLAWLQSVEEIHYNGRFPMAEIEYVDQDLPISTTGYFFSPFIPHDARTSGTPGFYAVFHLRNHSHQPVTVSLLGLLQNPLAMGGDEAKLSNTISEKSNATYLTMRTTADDNSRSLRGSLCLGASGGETSWLAGEFMGFIKGEIVWPPEGNNAFYSQTHECFLHDFRATGRLPSLGGSHSPARLLRLNNKEIDALSAGECEQLVSEMRTYAFAESYWQRFMEVDARFLADAQGQKAFLRVIRDRLDSLAGADRQGSENWGSGALCTSRTLQPGETCELIFTLAWHFPYHFSARGVRLGHCYENWFQNALQTCSFLMENKAEFHKKVRLFVETLYNTSLPVEFADSWSSQLSTLVKSTWWTQNGDFAVWEGLGCCGFHTTDITYQGSFSILALFPDLQKRQMDMGARFQRSDGRVHHAFAPDLSVVDEHFDRVDMNPQFVLLVCRDYLWTNDRDYLLRLWPHVVQAMDSIQLLDSDGDGLPDRETRRNTYDRWNFAGTPAYIASLWIAALKAAIYMAEALGEQEQAARWHATWNWAVPSFERRLWNGEYYRLWADGERHDECCMTDQIDGEWFTQLIGLGHSLPTERIRAALRAILTYNFREEGLINASYPPAKPRLISTYQNFQASAPWTGIEYAIASMLMDFGMASEGEEIVKCIHQRYLRAGRFWNHTECGDHYYRAMSSWAVLLAATGFKLDAPRQTVTLAPPMPKDVHAPWFSCTGWGSFSFADNAFQFSCLSGTIHLARLRLNLSSGSYILSYNHQPVNAQQTCADGLCIFELPQPLVVREGDLITVIAQNSPLTNS